MTDKRITSTFNLDDIKEMTDKLNDTLVDIKMTSFYYPGYSAFSEPYEYEYEESFKDIIGEFAELYRAGLIGLFNGRYERFLASKLDEDFTDLMLDPELYDNHFLIVRPNKLSYKLFKDDILFVYEDDDHFLVTISPSARRKFRELRGIK